MRRATAKWFGLPVNKIRIIHMPSTLDAGAAPGTAIAPMSLVRSASSWQMFAGYCPSRFSAIAAEASGSISVGSTTSHSLESALFPLLDRPSPSEADDRAHVRRSLRDPIDEGRHVVKSGGATAERLRDRGHQSDVADPRIVL